MMGTTMEIGIVDKPEVWLYNEHEEVIDELFMGWAVGILNESSQWIEVVTHYGYGGFLRREDVVMKTTEFLRKREDAGQMVFLARAITDVMEEPTVHSRSIVTLSRGSFVTVLCDTQNGYRRIRLSDGKEGYIPCISYECRKDSDAYLYDDQPETYFLRQKNLNRLPEKMLREELVMQAKKYLGTQYRWAGKSAMGLDCSGLTFMCYLMSGILIYRDAKIKANYPVRRILPEEMKMGDLLYFPGHIAMYIGDWRYIHATGNEHSFGCVINSLCRSDLDYRQDLAELLLMVGSIF